MNCIKEVVIMIAIAHSREVMTVVRRNRPHLLTTTTRLWKICGFAMNLWANSITSRLTNTMKVVGRKMIFVLNTVAMKVSTFSRFSRLYFLYYIILPFSFFFFCCFVLIVDDLPLADVCRRLSAENRNRNQLNKNSSMAPPEWKTSMII